MFELVQKRIAYRGKCVLTAQRIIRGFLARQQHQPRYKGIVKINAIRGNLKATKEIVNQLQKNKEGVLQQVLDVERLIESSILQIKVNKTIMFFVITCLNVRFFFKAKPQNQGHSNRYALQ